MRAVMCDTYNLEILESGHDAEIVSVMQGSCAMRLVVLGRFGMPN